MGKGDSTKVLKDLDKWFALLSRHQVMLPYQPRVLFHSTFHPEPQVNLATACPLVVWLPCVLSMLDFCCTPPRFLVFRIWNIRGGITAASHGLRSEICEPWIEL